MAAITLNGVNVTLNGVNVTLGGGASYEAAPLLLGRAIIGRPLIVSSGTLDDGSPVDTIQWYQCDDASKTAEASISGLATYTADTPNAQGKYLFVRSTASGTTEDSNIVGPILPNFN